MLEIIQTVCLVIIVIFLVVERMPIFKRILHRLGVMRTKLVFNFRTIRNKIRLKFKK